MVTEHAVTELLMAHQRGDRDAVDKLFALVYDDLHALAHRQLLRRRPGQTLNTTALVHEAYLKLIDYADWTWNDKVHFFAIIAKAMRHILVDYARKAKADKRGGQAHRTVLNTAIIGKESVSVDILDLDEGLARLAQFNERMSQVVELRFFGGFSHEEIAHVLETSLRTVERDWHKAKTFLFLILSTEDP